MPTLDYSSTPPPKPFRTSIFVASFVASAFCLILIFFERSWDRTYLPPPHWVSATSNLLETALFVTYFFLSLPAALATLCMIPWRKRSTSHLCLVTLACLLAMAGPFLFTPLIPAHSLHLPYVRILNYARSVGQSAIIYSNDNNHFPPHPAALLLTGQIAPKELSGPDLTPCTLPTPLPPESAWPSLAPDVDAHSIFIYTAADLPATDPYALNPAIILLYTKPSRVLPHHRILAFADGTAQLIPDPDLLKFFTASNTARAQLKLPPFTLDGPPPKPPLP